MRIDTGKSRARRFLLSAFVVALHGHALAEPPTDTAPTDEPTNYVFDDDKVLGDTVGAMGEVILVRERPARESLIRVRESFVPEVLKSVETL